MVLVVVVTRGARFRQKAGGLVVPVLPSADIAELGDDLDGPGAHEAVRPLPELSLREEVPAGQA